MIFYDCTEAKKHDRLSMCSAKVRNKHNTKKMPWAMRQAILYCLVQLKLNLNVLNKIQLFIYVIRLVFK